ncbi:YidH family protein [Mesobacillus maritimus]|uniref:YidH family protein n=1 Tax=Mesobacillus maritimus TaxID=1643336 RepID=UPI00384C2A5D
MMGSERVKTIENPPSEESKYIQQHLANERTFLAWVRTAIAIMGVGFLVTNLHFSMIDNLTAGGDMLATIIGLASVGLGVLTVLMSMIVYFKKIHSINNQSFVSSKTYIVTLSTIIIIIAILLAVYFVIV